MIIRGIPKDPENYIKVTSLVSEVLHMCGYQPKYLSDDGYLYYKKNINILSFMEDEGLKCEI